MCHYKKEQQQQQQQQQKGKWSKPLIAFWKKLLKLQAYSLNATNEVAQFKRQVTRWKL